MNWLLKPIPGGGTLFQAPVQGWVSWSYLNLIHKTLLPPSGKPNSFWGVYGVLKRGGMGGVGGGKEQWTVVGIKMNEKNIYNKKISKQTNKKLSTKNWLDWGCWNLFQKPCSPPWTNKHRNIIWLSTAYLSPVVLLEIVNLLSFCLCHFNNMTKWWIYNCDCFQRRCHIIRKESIQKTNSGREHRRTTKNGGKFDKDVLNDIL